MSSSVEFPSFTNLEDCILKHPSLNKNLYNSIKKPLSHKTALKLAELTKDTNAVGLIAHNSVYAVLFSEETQKFTEIANSPSAWNQLIADTTVALLECAKK